MENIKINPYQWFIDEQETDCTAFRIFGLDKSNKPVCVRVEDFQPYVFMELPFKQFINCNKALLVELEKKVNEIFQPYRIELVKRYRLYFAHLNDEGKRIKYPFLKMYFNNKASCKQAKYKNSQLLRVNYQLKFNIKIHEAEAPELLQLLTCKNISSSATLKFCKCTNMHEQISCIPEYSTSFKNITRAKEGFFTNPLILAFDLEVYSSDPHSMPNPKKTQDKVFMISCILSGENVLKKVLLTLGEIEYKEEHENFETMQYKSEFAMILAFKDFINEWQPNVITGYNIFIFDIPYLIERSKLLKIETAFATMGFLKGRVSSLKNITWSSGAYGGQQFNYLDIPGLLTMDLLPIVKRDFKLSDYKLNTIASMVIGDTKEDFNHLKIMEAYSRGVFNKNPTTDDKQLLGECGIYCIKDSMLVLDLLNKLKTWYSLVEMANICNIDIFSLYTRGQQIKVYSQVYKECFNRNYVVESDMCPVPEGEGFNGAVVLTPVPGVYDKVVPLDFASLYPTTIISNNIDYSTLVIDDKIPDSWCNITEWEDHVGCEHDMTKRKAKPKNILCGRNKFRWLKTEEKGIVPSVLNFLLEARKNTRKEMGEIKSKIKSCSDENEIKELEILLEVLDKRQLSYKVSSNSMYGSFGARKGYLLFMPGAKVVTFYGRKSITKVSNLIPEYGGKVVYGDSVTGDTPILLRRKNTILVKTIESLGQEWVSYEGFKLGEEGRKEKQQASSELEVWSANGWTKIKRVIRHKTKKRIFRITTHTGCVDVTEDHSLLTKEKQPIKPFNCELGDELLHGFPTLERTSENCESKKDLKMEFKNKVDAQILFCLLKSLGYNVSVKNDDKDFFRLKASKTPFRKNPCAIKKIIDLGMISDEEFVYDLETEEGNFQAGIGSLIVKNTDSNYVTFPGLESTQEIWDKAVDVADKISSHFEKPMKLEFENTIYWRFLILSKKRYMSLACDRDGNMNNHISRRGVILVRRDNSNVVRNMYAEMIMGFFNKENADEIIFNFLQNVILMFCRRYPSTDFVITKSVKDTGDGNMVDGMIGDYKVGILTDENKQHKFSLKKCSTDEEYYRKCLPSQVQLAYRMKNRGEFVTSGTRIPFIISTDGSLDNIKNGKIYEKIESYDYYLENKELVNIDLFYYLKQIVKPVDEVLNCLCEKNVFRKNVGRFSFLVGESSLFVEDFAKKQWKIHIAKYMMLQEYKNLINPLIV